MAERSKRVKLYDESKVPLINKDTMKLYNKYMIDLELRELSETTIYQYGSDLLAWFCYIYDNQDNKCVTDITEEELVEFYYFCKKSGNNSRRMRRRMSSISAFYIFLKKKKLLPPGFDPPSEYIDRPQRDNEIIAQPFLTLEQVHEIKSLLNQWVNDANTVKGKEKAMTMRLWILFGLSTMARVNAIRNITWEQIDFDAKEAQGVKEKEGYIVDLYFSDEVGHLLKELYDYRRENKIDDGGYLFYSTTNGNICPISSGTLNDWTHKVGDAIGVTGLHNHSLRKGGATLLYQNAESIENIAEMLHHKSTDTTLRHYIKKDKEKIKTSKQEHEVV